LGEGLDVEVETADTIRQTINSSFSNWFQTGSIVEAVSAVMIGDKAAGFLGVFY
jgi:hypothetical protein